MPLISDQNEIWADIPGFRRYAVSNFGHVWNKVFERPMRPSKSGPQGHLKISLIDDDGFRHAVSVAELVAQAFVEPPNYMCTGVILLDGDLSNVAAYNLAWRAPRTAYLYGRQMRRESQPDYVFRFPVQNINTGEIYENIFQAGITEGSLFSEILASIHMGDRIPPHGHTFKIFKRV